MPTFGATRRTSGRAGLPSGNSGGTGTNITGVGHGGVGNYTNAGATVVNGFSNGGPVSLRSGPNESISWELEVNSAASKFKGTFSINGVIPLGITRDSNGSALGGCRVDLFESGSNNFLQTTTSNESGNYSFVVSSNSSSYFCRAYKAGGTNVFGTTDETIIAL